MLPKYLLLVNLGTYMSSTRITEHTGVGRKFKICYSTLPFFALRHQRLREDKGCSYRHKIKYLQNQTRHHFLQVQSFFYTSVNLTMPSSANCLPIQLLSCTGTAIFLASLHSFPLESKCLNVRFFKPILFKYFQTLIQDFFFFSTIFLIKRYLFYNIVISI